MLHSGKNQHADRNKNESFFDALLVKPRKKLDLWEVKDPLAIAKHELEQKNHVIPSEKSLHTQFERN